MNINFYKLQLSLLSVLVFFVLNSCKEKTGSEEKAIDPVDLVYPLLDTENSRWFFFSSACRPFGMVNLSPDTRISGAWGSGYSYNTDTIRGFSHIHAWQLSGLSVMPVVLSEENNTEIFSDYSSKFSHEKEKVAPGYHYVELEKHGIVTELTSTKRVGFHRYKYPKGKRAALVFNVNGELGPSFIVDGSLKQTGEKQLQGQLVNSPTSRRPKPASVFFTVEINSKIKSVQKDESSGNYLVELEDAFPVLMKAAISYTSVENASINMLTELPGWDFDNTVKESQEEWNSMLSRILVEGGTEKDQRRFYTDLWHALQGRRVISDVNGAYPDNTGESFRIGQIPLDNNGKPQFNQYNSDSFWGAQWTLNTLWQLVYPEIAKDFIQSFMQYYKDGGLIPRGPSGGNYTFVMTGASSTPFFVAAFQKGIIKKENAEEIYEALKKNHMPGGIMEKAGYEHKTNIGGGLTYYIENGYVPYPLPEGSFGGHQDGALQTLEYAYQDWTLAQMAKVLGHTADYDYFMKRSNNYKNLYDTESGWIRPKNVDGKWRDPFDPYEYQSGFVESNGAQGTWFVPHDLPGLGKLMGGNEAAAKKLDASFREAEKLGFTSGTAHSKELHPELRRIPINYGNQPSMQTAFVFNLIEHPWLTQYWSRKVLAAAFSGLAPNTGYNGDEDQGLMGSLSVLMKIGLFQMNGGTEENPQYQLGSSIFDKIKIQLNKEYYPGNEFEIEIKNNSAENVYIQSATFNDKPVQKYWINHDDLVKGGKLILQMGANPNMNWGK
jgi:predicted alpha-1,2-mannosidase